MNAFAVSGERRRTRDKSDSSLSDLFISTLLIEFEDIFQHRYSLVIPRILLSQSLENSNLNLTGISVFLNSSNDLDSNVLLLDFIVTFHHLSKSTLTQLR